MRSMQACSRAVEGLVDHPPVLQTAAALETLERECARRGDALFASGARCARYLVRGIAGTQETAAGRTNWIVVGTHVNEKSYVPLHAITVILYFENFRSVVTTAASSCMAVAMMNRSAGSLWCHGRRFAMGAFPFCDLTIAHRPGCVTVHGCSNGRP